MTQKDTEKAYRHFARISYGLRVVTQILVRSWQKLESDRLKYCLTANLDDAGAMA